MLMCENEAHLVVLYDDAIYTQDVAIFKVSITPSDLEFDTYCDLESHGPPVNHWLYHEIESVGLLDALLGYQYCFSGTPKEAVVKQMLELGVAPEQPFLVYATYWATKHWTDYGWEYDAGIDWSIIHIEPWSTEKILISWESVLSDM